MPARSWCCSCLWSCSCIGNWARCHPTGCGGRAPAMSVPLEAYLALSALLFVLGTTGVLVRRNALVVFMSIELMLNAVNLTFVAFARQRLAIEGQLAVFFVVVVAAVEVVVGL